MAKKKAIIFDCFGVLLVDNLQIMRQELGKKDPAAEQEVKDIIAQVNRGMIPPIEARPIVAKLFGLTTDEYVHKVTSGEGKNHELMNYIKELKKSYKIAMLSNIGAGSLLSRFMPSELNEHFDEVLASGDIGYAKPEPEAYEITAQRLNVRLDECIFTDDREIFCEGARAVGMQAIRYCDFKQFKSDLETLLAKN